MVNEGGRRFNSFERKPSMENPFGRGTEPRGDNGPEDAPERETSWLIGLGVTQETLERIRQYPAYQESSTEYLLYHHLLGKLVELEQSAGWDPILKQRVRNLMGSIRAAGFPNMTVREQVMLRDHSEAGLFRTAVYEINPNTIEDVRWVWRTFGLDVPTTQ